MSERIEVVSVRGGKFHRLADPMVGDGAPWESRLMLCGRSLEPHNFFPTAADADKYTGGRLTMYACAHCEAAAAKSRVVVGMQVSLETDGRTYLGDVTRVDGDRLEVRHFNGEMWPFKPSAAAVTVLGRDWVR